MVRSSGITVSYSVLPKYPVAGPSKPKQVAVPKQPEVKPKVPPVTKAEKQQVKPKEEPKPTEKGKEKLRPAGSGKLDFFKPKVKEIKKEETSKPSAAKTFFSAPKKEHKDAAATTTVCLASDSNAADSNVLVARNEAKIDSCKVRVGRRYGFDVYCAVEARFQVESANNSRSETGALYIQACP